MDQAEIDLEILVSTIHASPYLVAAHARHSQSSRESRSLACNGATVLTESHAITDRSPCYNNHFGLLCTMAAHERPSSNGSLAQPVLAERLAKVLTKGASFKLYHVSTPPSRTAAIYSPAPGDRPDRTYLESHFLAVSIDAPQHAGKQSTGESDKVLVFAIEVLIYSTTYSTTFFVSKADSTGYLHLLKLPKGSPSPIRDICATFLSYLVERRRRPGVKSVISLFARAQGQYLFPGSSDNDGKHVLDDRGLIRWWCRVMSPVLEDASKPAPDDTARWQSVKGYLTVPGLDSQDVRLYLPPATRSHWTVGHPLQSITKYITTVPPRCLVPRFPDDPKARFLDELDDEIPNSKDKGARGEWKSVRTLAEFWETMAFRQECSAGRLVGFIWIVFEPEPQVHEKAIGADQSISTLLLDSQTGVLTPAPSHESSSQPPVPTPTPNNCKPGPSNQGLQPVKKRRRTKTKTKPQLTGPIKPRQPRIKTKATRAAQLDSIPTSTAYYTWPQEGRGSIVVDEKDYGRMHELLLRLDFTNLGLAVSSTARWVGEVKRCPSASFEGEGKGWEVGVEGVREVQLEREGSGTGNGMGLGGEVRTLNVGLVRKKRKNVA